MPQQLILDVEFDPVSFVHYIQFCLREIPIMPSSLDSTLLLNNAFAFLADFKLKTFRPNINLFSFPCLLLYRGGI